jgi:hypothetical protein
MIRRVRAALLITALATPTIGIAQETVTAYRPLRPMRIAKWGTLVAAAGTADYGFVKNGQADDLFADLERLCQDQPVQCRMRSASGAYQDARFEQLYADVLALDRRAHTTLLMSQIAVGASVVFFLLDLGNARRPPDIPFVPTAVGLSPRSDGSLALAFTFPLQRLSPR